MADNPNPLRQGPENYTDLGDMLGQIMSIMSKQLENMLPCRVISYDRTNNTAVVQILVKIVLTGGEQERAQVGPVPVFVAGGGNYVISFPLKPGDLGWLIANDRDITKFRESLDMAAPGTYRTHSFNDGVLFPDPIRNFTTDGEDTNMVIQSMDGTQRISMGDNQLHITHPVGMTVDAPGMTFNGAFQADSVTAKNGITETFVDANGKIMNFAGGSLVGSA